MSPFLHAVPLFGVLIALEWAFAYFQKRDLFQLEDSLRNLSCGVAEEIVAVLARLMTGGVYVYLFNHFSAVHYPSAVWQWAVALVGVDFFYYWFHRLSHRVGFLWALHSVHHQSHFYNLTVALRQSALGGFFAWVFYLPLALVGVPAEMMASAYALNLLYQFWIHTETIPKMGWFESLFNTPSHHRVHHGKNPIYLDKNYAGALICWDRLFGTFIPETEKPEYGVVSPLKSENAVWANLEGWVSLYQKARRVRPWSHKLYAWVAPPEWEAGPIAPSPQRPPLDARVARYAIIQFALILALAIGYFLIADRLSPPRATLASIWLILSLGNLGALLNGARWAQATELVRRLALLPLLYFLLTR